MNGQCEVKLDGRNWHIQFGMNSMELFCRHYGIDLKDLAPPKKGRWRRSKKRKNPFEESELGAFRDMVYCGLRSGNTRMELPKDFDTIQCGNWLDQASEKTIKAINEAYLTSRVLGKSVTGKR